MVQTIDTKPISPEPAVQADTASAPVPAAGIDRTPPEPVEVKGLFNNFTSAFWAFAMPLLGFARYLAEGVVELFKFNDAKEWPKINNEKNKWGGRIQATMAGTIMTAGASFFLERTYKDMKNEFAESLAWEFHKKPEEVNIADMLNSKNQLMKDAKDNYVKYNARRFAVILPFFSDYFGHLVAKAGKNFKHVDKVTQHFDHVSSKAAVALGTASVSLYLVSDVLGRKESFFERLQKLHRNKINQAELLGEHITTNDLINLYARSGQDKDADHPPRMNSQEWRNDEILFGRMADLMNQTYGNEPAKEHANFGLSKFIYMVGMGLLKSKNLEKDMAYVEVANVYGISGVEKLAAAVNSGKDLHAALASYPLAAKREAALQVTEADNTMLKSMGIAPEPVAESPEKSFANEGLRKSRPEAPAASHVEKAAKPAEALAGISV